jgi:tRNA pseudouridine38-40 synthase
VSDNSSEYRLKLTIEYDGTNFHGWQRQAKVRTVQEDLEVCLSKILRHPITVYGAGRTDSGVHASGQVAHIITDNYHLTPYQLKQAVNSFLKPDLKIISIEPISDRFHARFSAIRRRYKYLLVRKYRPLTRMYYWYPKYEWNDSLILDVVKIIEGKHCFRSFCRATPGENDYISNVTSADWKHDAKGATFEVCANRYYHRMVRGLVHTLFDVGRGYISPEEFEQLVQNPKRNGDVTMAPPQGLTLVSVEY